MANIVITTTLNEVLENVYWAKPNINEKEREILLDEIGEHNGDKPLMFSTIIKLTDPRFAFNCLKVINGHDDKLHSLLADIDERKIYRQRDRLYPKGGSPIEHQEKAKKDINSIREGKFYTNKEGSFLSGSGLVSQVNDSEVINAHDALRNIPPSERHDLYNMMTATAEAILTAERKWSGEQLIKYFG